MRGGFWALINRALTVDAKSLRPHLYRLFFVGINCLSVLWCEATSMVSGAPGLRLFQSIAHIDMVLLTIAGFSIFATAISEEKEDQMIGLLKMTGVSHIGLILGKSTSRMFSVLMLLVVQLPFTLFAITLGGILMHQMFAAYLALFAYLVLVANLGLFCSVVTPTARSAAGLAGVLLVCYFTLPSIAWALVGTLPTGAVVFWDEVIEFIAQTSVVYRLNETMATGFVGSPWSVQVWTNLAAGAVFFFASWLVFDACTQSDDTSGGVLSLWKRRSRRSRPCWNAALVWKDFRFVTGGLPMLGVKIFAIVVIVWLLASINSPASAHDIGQYLLIVVCPIAIIESAIYASRVFRDEL
ncbi:MAG TPA: hypothetical protein VHB77_11720, partial [Planctomycetaceae bacterium]|nr:hypothetical protein [Planctomycetaceae bacterium]